MGRKRKPVQFTLSDESNEKLDTIVNVYGKKEKAYKNRSRVMDESIKMFYKKLFEEDEICQ